MSFCRPADTPRCVLRRRHGYGSGTRATRQQARPLLRSVSLGIPRIVEDRSEAARERFAQTATLVARLDVFADTRRGTRLTFDAGAFRTLDRTVVPDETGDGCVYGLRAGSSTPAQTVICA